MPPTVTMSAQQLEEEVVKQLSKDSYGVVQVPISKEVLSLLSAQQERIKEQEKQIIEFKTKLQGATQPMSARVERNSKIIESRSSDEAVDNFHSQRSRVSYASSADAYQAFGYQADVGTVTDSNAYSSRQLYSRQMNRASSLEDIHPTSTAQTLNWLQT
jgi:hypothetical protein